MSVDASERVEVWNTFFKLAREQAVFAKKLEDASWLDRGHTFLGGTLDNEKTYSLAVVAWCLLALEARESHLVEEFRDKNLISRKEAEAVHRLNIERKWALLPRLAGKRKRVEYDKLPHSAIVKLCKYRNMIFHVKYDELVANIPSIAEAVDLFNGFVYAMEDMNVILKRHKKHRKRVLRIALD
jgi:hypothetical protein